MRHVGTFLEREEPPTEVDGRGARRKPDVRYVAVIEMVITKSTLRAAFLDSIAQ